MFAVGVQAQPGFPQGLMDAVNGWPVSHSLQSPHGAIMPVAGSPSGSLSLKRAHFSASPATGLAFKEENVYLSKFLSGFGAVLPVVDEATLRAALVDCMHGSAQDCGDRKQRHGGDDISEYKAAARAAVLWAAAAAGALLEGNPRHLEYLYKAEAALGACADFPSAETLMATLVTATVRCMLKDMEAFAVGVRRAAEAFTVLPVEEKLRNELRRSIAGRAASPSVVSATRASGCSSSALTLQPR